MDTRIRAVIAGVAVAALGTAGALAAGGGTEPDPSGAQKATNGGKVVEVKDARLKFEINSTDGDGGVHLFLDADSWKEISLFDPAGREVLTTKTSGRMARQGGTELFVESAEPPFAKVPIPQLLKRFPKGSYAVRGVALNGDRYVGAAIVNHRLPDGPKLIGPHPADGPQDPADVTVRWDAVAPPAGGRIIGYQVIVVRPDTGIRAMPNVTLDVTMPPTATSLRVPPGFLRSGTEYEWEVLAVEGGGNQTLSSSTFTTRK